jgi:hypothetical protein
MYLKRLPRGLFRRQVSLVATAALYCFLFSGLAKYAQQSVCTTKSAVRRSLPLLAGHIACWGGQCQVRSWAFVAFVAETTGAWNQAAQRLVRKVVRAHCIRPGAEQKDTTAKLWLLLSRAVVRAVARQLIRARSASMQGELPPAGIVGHCGPGVGGV